MVVVSLQDQLKQLLIKAGFPEGGCIPAAMHDSDLANLLTYYVMIQSSMVLNISIHAYFYGIARGLK